ncbi:MAG: hypothetical protein NXH89_00645 [Cyclobacteriaceae bacterium]|nr:hypothetical protein [Cyclobacteriaceae bacterium]
MPKPKKFTIRIFENRSLKEKGSIAGPYFPLYCSISYNRRVKTIKSLTFELLDKINFGVDLLLDGHEEIEKNDRRVLEQYRSLVESTNREFSIDLISSENKEYEFLKTPLFYIAGEKIRNQLFFFFQGKGQNPKFPLSQLLIAENQNWVYFLGHMKEISPKKFEEFIEFYQPTEKILLEFEKLNEINFFPYLIDIQVNNPITKNLKELIQLK